MISKEEAISAQEFHHVKLRANGRCEIWRRNGRTQTWKTRPEDFRVPVKFGMYSFGQLTQAEADQFVAGTKCPHHGLSLVSCRVARC